MNNYKVTFNKILKKINIKLFNLLLFHRRNCSLVLIYLFNILVVVQNMFYHTKYDCNYVYFNFRLGTDLFYEVIYYQHLYIIICDIIILWNKIHSDSWSKF